MLKVILKTDLEGRRGFPRPLAEPNKQVGTAGEERNLPVRLDRRA
jgi:hypothetical protein